MTSLNIKSFLQTLEQNPEHADILTRANQLNKIRQTIAATDIIPASINRHYKLGPLSQGTLTLLAENASVATKLKHISPSILLKMQQLGWKITAVKIKLQKPDFNSHENARSNQATEFYAKAAQKRLSRSGIESLNHLARSLPESELKHSIHALLNKCCNSNSSCKTNNSDK
ncbi:MAG: DUF721 domain-containing protein [Nitrosomonas sp.]|nr:DUF721 domain-containing protein [Nitrosomonas sp.]